MDDEIAASWVVTVRTARRTVECWVDAWWRPVSPWEVRLAIYADEPPIVWTLARELLAVGRFTAAGVPGADVHVRPGPRGLNAEVVEIELSVDGVTATLVVCGADVAEFLERTFAVVPLGAERLVLPDFVPAEWTTEGAS